MIPVQLWPLGLSPGYKITNSTLVVQTLHERSLHTTGIRPKGTWLVGPKCVISARPSLPSPTNTLTACQHYSCVHFSRPTHPTPTGNGSNKQGKLGQFVHSTKGLHGQKQERLQCAWCVTGTRSHKTTAIHTWLSCIPYAQCVCIYYTCSYLCRKEHGRDVAEHGNTRAAKGSAEEASNEGDNR